MLAIHYGLIMDGQRPMKMSIFTYLHVNLFQSDIYYLRSRLVIVKGQRLKVRKFHVPPAIDVLECMECKYSIVHVIVISLPSS